MSKLTNNDDLNFFYDEIGKLIDQLNANGISPYLIAGVMLSRGGALAAADVGHDTAITLCNNLIGTIRECKSKMPAGGKPY